MSYDRFEIAQKLAYDGWCPDTYIADEEEGGIEIQMTMFISNKAIDDEIAKLKAIEGEDE